MPPVKSIKLSIICGAVLLGTFIVCSTAFAQTPTPGPSPASTAFPTPTPAPPGTNPSPPPGVSAGGVAIPVPVLDIGQYIPGRAHFGQDPDVPNILNNIQGNFMQALDQLAVATSGAPGFGLLR